MRCFPIFVPITNPKIKYTMNKGELVEKLAADAGITKTQANAAIDSFTEAVTKTLKKGDKAIIKDFDIDLIPLKLLEMGCLPGNKITLLQVAPLGDPLYFNVNDSHVAIRLETASCCIFYHSLYVAIVS